MHWARKIGGNYQYNHSLLNQPIPEKLNIEKLLWASVGNYPKKIFKKENELKIKEINLKNLPAHFGIDRALGCYAGLQITNNPHKKDIVIADFGTTLSITKINAEGQVIGGQLIPGFLTQLKSMVINTRLLKMPNNFNIPKETFLINTEEAMIKGVINSLLGALNLALKPDKDILIICGGDSEIVRLNLQKKNQEVIIKPNLVMEGMIMHYQK
tara:strand:- start:28384 stop:29022 length:639 start_codon:yes stop_codon:yes gene_type:complete